MRKFFPHLVYDRDDGIVFAWGGPGKIIIAFKNRDEFVAYATGDKNNNFQPVYRGPADDWSKMPYNDVWREFARFADGWDSPWDKEKDEEEDEPRSLVNDHSRLRDRLQGVWPGYRDGVDETHVAAALEHMLQVWGLDTLLDEDETTDYRLRSRWGLALSKVRKDDPVAEILRLYKGGAPKVEAEPVPSIEELRKETGRMAETIKAAMRKHSGPASDPVRKPIPIPDM